MKNSHFNMFSNIHNQDRVKEILSRTVADGKIGHAYIFEGTTGSGKLDMALAFAAAIAGAEDITSNPDIRVVTNALYDPKLAERKALAVETIRQMKAEVYIKPYGERKVYIVPNADTVTVTSAFLSMQNSLLKVFEEPPSYCTIILLAENANSFLPTILSRAQVIKFSPLDKEEHLRYLLNDEQKANLRENILKFMGQIMDGGKYSATYSLIAYIKTQVKKDNKSNGVILEIIGLILNDLLHGQSSIAAVDMQTTAKMLDVYFKYVKMINANGNFNACIECMILGILDEVRGGR